MSPKARARSDIPPILFRWRCRACAAQGEGWPVQTGCCKRIGR